MAEQRDTAVIGRALPRADGDTGLLPGDDLGGYRIVRRIASGGMAAVYEGHHRLLGRAVAIKLAHARVDDAGDTHTRFLREAQFLSRLDHPGVVQVFDVGHAADGRPWMAMELLSGENLAQLLSRETIEPDRAVAWLRAIAETLACAHQEGAVHRDLKPDNVFVTTEGQIKVLDWGIAFMRPREGQARFTRGSLLVGTPQYTSPEQARGFEVDGRADVYSLGVVAYEMLSGAVPFDGATDVETAARHLLDAPPPLDAVEPGLAALVMRMLAKQPSERPSIEDVVDALSERSRGGPSGS